MAQPDWASSRTMNQAASRPVFAAQPYAGAVAKAGQKRGQPPCRATDYQNLHNVSIGL